MRIFFISVFSAMMILACKSSDHAGADLEAAKTGTKTTAKKVNFAISCPGDLGEDPTTVDIVTPTTINDFASHTFATSSPLGIWTEASAKILTWQVSGSTLSTVINQKGGYNQIYIDKLECGGGDGGTFKLRKYVGGMAGMGPDKYLKGCTCKYTK